MNRLPFSCRKMFAALAAGGFVALGVPLLVHAEAEKTQAAAAPDPVASKAAFLKAYPVLMHPRCLNCHPAGSQPFQGDDSHPHTMNVQRGKDGKGVTAMKCANCHQETNLPGLHMPPGNPKWHLPTEETPLVFEGKNPAQLAMQLKDPKLNGGKTLEQILEHVTKDELVLWGWNPGDGRTKPPLSHEDFSQAMRDWIENGAVIPD